MQGILHHSWCGPSAGATPLVQEPLSLASLEAGSYGGVLPTAPSWKVGVWVWVCVGVGVWVWVWVCVGVGGCVGVGVGVHVQVCTYVCSTRCLTPNWLMTQMKYRYDREIDNAQRCAIPVAITQ